MFCATLMAMTLIAQTAAEPAAGLTLIAAGKTDYRIVVPEPPSPVLEYAAGELQHFLAEVSGVRLPIVRASQIGGGPAIVLGVGAGAGDKAIADRLATLKEDGVLIKTVGRNLVLSGQNDRGRLYSVYVLLERFLGVRFLAWDCTIVPKAGTVTLPPIDFAYSPPFMYRETLCFNSFPKVIAARQRLNGPMTQCDATVGGKIDFFPYVHSFCQLVPPAEYYKDHPEYFSLVGGKRTNLTVHGQLCLSNPDVLKVATQRVIQWMDGHPNVPIFDVSQNDGDGACECEKCAAIVKEEGSQHGPIMRFVNAIADEARKTHPDTWVETLAYAYSTKPSAIARPRDNVIIRLCHGGCFFHGFESCGLGANFAGYIDQWSKLTRRVFIWHYITNFAHYLAPNQNLGGMVKDIQFHVAHGVNGLMVQGDYQSPGGELAELRQYLASQLMWDPKRDPAAIRREFCTGYYGAAADNVLAFLALMDQQAADTKVHAFAAWDPKDTVTPAFVAEGLKILAQARSHANTPETGNRVAKLLLPLWYMQLVYPDRYGLAPAAAAGVLREFKAVVQANAITHYCEGGSNIAGWLTQMEAKYEKATSKPAGSAAK